jgi:hypothetical protein
MKKLLVAALALPILLLASQAAATPTLDGAIVGSEWSTGLIVNAFDPDESAIPDAYDIQRIALYEETAGGGIGNGAYILFQLYGIPTLTSLDTLPPIDPVFYSIGFDFNLDGDYLDAVDRIVDYRSAGLLVYNGLGSVIAGTPLFSTGAVLEMYIPSSMYVSGNFNGFALLDNGGAPPDDRLPDTSDFTTTPEPGSAMLLGMGLLGFAGMIRRKFTA